MAGDKIDEQRIEDAEVAAADTKRGFLELPLPQFMRTGMAQNIVVGFVCFCCPGMFNAMQGLGNAGGSDPTIGAIMNACLYAFFAIFGYFGGLLFNVFGNRLLLFLGGLTYCGYAIGVYVWGVNASMGWFAILMSSLLGVGAGCLWTAQGAMTMSYAPEAQKGLYTTVFWVIFNLGAMIGGLMTFGLEYNSDLVGVSAVSYFVFCALMIVGAFLGLLLVVPPNRVIRADGKRVVYEKAASPGAELKNVLNLFKDKYMLLLTPLILQSNWFYTYDFGAINGQLFNNRTRGLNSAYYWGFQMVGAYLIGTVFLDMKSLSRRTRAIWGLLIVAGLNTLQWAYAFYVQFGWQDGGYDKDRPIEQRIDFLQSEFWLPAVLYAFMGICDSMVQTYAYWLMGAIANSPAILARYAGYYKGIQSLGAAIAWILDASGMMYRWQAIICFILASIMIPPTYIVASWITEHSSDEDDVAENSAQVLDVKGDQSTSTMSVA